LADLVKIGEKKINYRSKVLIISVNVVNNYQESLYQPRESIWITNYTVNLIVDSLSFTAANTATAVLSRGANPRVDWLTK